VGIVDRTRGANAQQAIVNLTPDVKLMPVDHRSEGPVGPYQAPFPLDDRHFFLSCDGTLILRDYEGTEQTIVLRPEPDGSGYYDVRPLRPRPRPPVIAPLLPTEEETGTLIVQDVYRGLEGHVKPGEVKAICVVEELAKVGPTAKGRRGYPGRGGNQTTAISAGSTYAPKKIWGYAAVEADGSAHFRVPARKPLYFMALDAEGRAVQRMRSFTHLKPGETQGCIGCHEPRFSAPPRAESLPRALSRSAQNLVPPAWGVIGFSFPRMVQPILEKHCAACHGDKQPQGDLRLVGASSQGQFSPAYLALVQPDIKPKKGQSETELTRFVQWIATDNGNELNILEFAPKTWGSPVSRLADLVLSCHPDAQGKKRLALTAAERAAIFAWIDLNVPYYGSWGDDEPAAPKKD
jgi:hypothetical protein